VTELEFRERLLSRARKSQVAVQPEWLESLERYFAVLSRWNGKINLTALPLADPTDLTFDRLLIEPLAAARFVSSEGSDVWWDLGSGGGSPAIPMKIARPALELVMVEARMRKAVFLREAVRCIGVDGVAVVNRRFDELSDDLSGYGAAGLVTVRAVRPDAELFAVAANVLRDGGTLLLFRTTDEPLAVAGFRYVESARLIHDPATYVAVLVRMFHVEQ